MRRVILVFVALLTMLSASSIAQTVPTVDGFQMPFDGTPAQSCEFGIYGACYHGNEYHLGEDYDMPVVGTPIYACADGVVKEARESDGYGGIVLIEHQLSSGEYVVSLCAHMLSSTLEVAAGNQVSRGQVIGYVAATGQNGGTYDPHVHFGIHKNSYDSTPLYACNGGWRYQGYSADECAVDDWYDPSDFVAAHPVESSIVGWFEDGWHDDGTSQSFVDKYNSQISIGHPLGDPWQNPDGGWTAYVHEQNGMLIQDFQGANNAYDHPYTALIRDNVSTSIRYTRLLKEGFWDVWMNYHGWINFGPPITDEYPNDGGKMQTFRRYGDSSSDYENFYFRWDEGNIITVLDQSYNEVDLSELTVTAGAKAFVATQLDDFPISLEAVQKDSSDKAVGESGGGSAKVQSIIKVSSDKAVATSSLADGVYHSGLLVANFDQPFELVTSRNYSNFYAVINGGVIPIDSFNMDGDLVIYIDSAPPGAEIVFDYWYINPNPGTVGELLHVEGGISNIGGSSITIPEVRIELLNPNGTEFYHYSEYNVYLESGWGWSQWLYGNPNFAGNHTARFRLYMDGQWQTYAIKTVYVQDVPPVANYSAAPMSGDAPLTVQFTDLSSGSTDEWWWQFGDGSTSTSQHPSHTYTAAGSYTVSLIATNSGGSDTVVGGEPIVVNSVAPLEGIFLALPTSGDAPLTVQFTDHSTGNPISWAWDFGDGGTSTEQNPSHVYGISGVYDVHLIVNDGVTSHEGVVFSYITVTDPSGCTGNGAYHFNGVDQYLSFPPYNPGLSDLTIEGWINLDIYGDDANCIFYQEQSGATGRPNLKVVVNTNGTLSFGVARPGSSGSDDQYITSNFVIPFNQWTYFACSRESGVYRIYINGQLDIEIDHGVNFDVSGITSVGHVGRRYNASYPGNQYYVQGAVDEIRVSNVARVATEISNYYTSSSEMTVDANTVLLWHMNGEIGNSDKLLNTQGNSAFDLTEYNGPTVIGGFNECLPLIADFTANPISAYTNSPVQFTDQSTGNTTSWFWDFGDGITSSVQNPQHTYVDSGSYTVSLTVGDGNITDIKIVSDCVTVQDATSGVNDTPLVLALHNNHPNPFNPQTIISYSLPSSQRVRLVIYDVRGRPIATLVDGVMPEGRHEAIWRGKNTAGQTVNSGAYFYRLTTAEGSVTHKMMLIK